MTPQLKAALEEQSAIQLRAVNWQDGAALVLAGPGAGKTRVLTTRIARILSETADKNFRILALTFTTKAAKEMAERIENLVPGLTGRTFVGTFHAFCAQVLSLHGSHIGIKPDFGIYDQESDRVELLAEAFATAHDPELPATLDAARWIKVIDGLKAIPVSVEKSAARYADASTGKLVARIYQLYETALRDRNALDFNGLILEVCRLVGTVPAIAARIRRTYQYWLVDEFQDTSPAQYTLIRMMAGEEFKNIFAVADDDQIIYQWAGASYRQIERYRNHFHPELIQLVENHRCPAEIVDAANMLVAYNTQRTPDKTPIVATHARTAGTIETRAFDTGSQEYDEIAKAILADGKETWGRTAVLARTRQTLESVLASLRLVGVKAVLSQRRDRYISPQFAWLQSLLDQTVRPTDRIVFRVLVNAANRITQATLDPASLIAEAEAAGHTYIEHWISAIAKIRTPIAEALESCARKLVLSRSSWKEVVREIVPILVSSGAEGEGIVSDADEDKSAWDSVMREIRVEKGGEPELQEVVQGMSLRSKEPPRDPGAVVLLTVHGAKGLEFDFVYVAGLAESLLPSWQSLKRGDTSPEMEEERRNCFVAITRTKKRLRLSWAAQYDNWRKAPSRFLSEMKLI